jgi:hypothetical protein
VKDFNTGDLWEVIMNILVGYDGSAVAGETLGLAKKRAVVSIK